MAVRIKLTKEEALHKAKALNNSLVLFAWRLSKYPQAEAALKKIYDEVSVAYNTKRYDKKYKDHIRVIVLDLFVANFKDPTLYITYSRNRNDYGPSSRLGSMFLSYDITIKIIKFLKDKGYIEHHDGMPIPPNRKSPRIRATKKLIDLLKEEHKVEVGMIRWDDKMPVLILRDENKKDINYEDTEDTLRMKENLKIINKNLDKQAILLYVTDDGLRLINEELLNEELQRDQNQSTIDFTRKYVRRVFNNGSFEQGGRFYGGWWQSIPRRYRTYIRLDDKDIVECDYSGLHINMLYALEKKIPPKGDVYFLEGYSNDVTFRDFVKRLLLVMINSKDRAKARAALHEEVHHKKKQLKLPTEILSTSAEHIYPIMDAFAKKHAPIRHYFNTGKGIDLMYLDSQIAEKVMLRFAKMRYAILPMHDSFIIHHGLEDELKQAMEDEFFDMFGVKGKVDLKYNSITERRKLIDTAKGDVEDEEEYPPEPSLAELMEDMKEYSVYFDLLNQHWRYNYDNTGLAGRT